MLKIPIDPVTITAQLIGITFNIANPQKIIEQNDVNIIKIILFLWYSYLIKKKKIWNNKREKVKISITK